MLKMAIKHKWIVGNLIGAAVFVGLLAAAASFGLSAITHHGESVSAPDFTNMTLSQAQEAAQQAGVNVKVTDSVFVKRLQGGVVYRQQPKPGATVKPGRSIFLTVNSIVPRKVVFPNLYGYSLTEARAELRNRGLNTGRLNYVKDIATNNVLSVSCDGITVEAGDLVVSGSTIDLTVGVNKDDNQTLVPNLTGKKYIQAVDLLHDRGLNMGKVRFDDDIRSYADSVNAVVWKQSDAPGTSKSLGSDIGLRLTLDSSKLQEN